MLKMTLFGLLERGEFRTVELKLRKNDTVLKKLNELEIGKAIDYCTKDKFGNAASISILCSLLDVAGRAMQDKILNYILEPLNSKYIPYDVIETNLKVFLKKVKETNNYYAIQIISQLLSKNPSAYQREIDEITDFMLKSEDTSIKDINIIQIVKLNGFNPEKFHSYFLKRTNRSRVAYLLNIPEEYQESFINLYLNSNPNTNDLKIFMYTLDGKLEPKFLSKELESMLLDCIKDIPDEDLKCKYLLIYLETILKNVYNKEITFIIMLSNKLYYIKELMGVIPEEIQDKICEEYLALNNHIDILNLAITTDCKTTYKLVDTILETYSDAEILDLISNLSGRFLSYALDRIIKRDTRYYLSLIDTLYLLSANNSIEVIEFIFIYHLEYLFQKEIVERLRNFLKVMQEKEQNLTLERK